MLLDDGVALAIPAGTLRPSTTPGLRRGQRVLVHLDCGGPTPVVRLVHVWTVSPGDDDPT